MRSGSYAGASGRVNRYNGFGECSLENKRVGSNADIRTETDELDFEVCGVFDVLSPAEIAKGGFVQNYGIALCESFVNLPTVSSFDTVLDGEMFAGKIMKTKFSMVMNVILGVIGGMVGGFLLGLIGLTAHGLIGGIISGVLGSCVLIYLVRLIKK